MYNDGTLSNFAFNFNLRRCFKVAKKDAFLRRGTPTAEESALTFMAARKKAVAAGLSKDSPLLSAQNPVEQ